MIHFIYLFWKQVLVAVVEARSSAGLRRQKREWIVPPQKLNENMDYTQKEYIAKVRLFMVHCHLSLSNGT